MIATKEHYDLESETMFGLPFDQLNLEQQGEVIEEVGDEMMELCDKMEGNL